MFTVLKSWLFGVPQPLYLSAAPVTGRLSLAGQQNDEVSIAFIRADVNAPPTAGPSQRPAVVAIYRARQSRDEYLREWLAAQADVVRVVKPPTADHCRRDAGLGSTPRCGEQRVPAASHDRREALRLHTRCNPPARPVRPVRPIGAGRSRGLQAPGGAGTGTHCAGRTPRAGTEPWLPQHVVHISRCLTELGQDEPSGGGVFGIAALAGAESLGLSRSIQDMGRGW